MEPTDDGPADQPGWRGPLNDALARLTALQFRNEVGHLLDEVVDRLPVIAADRERERMLPDPIRRVALEALLRCSLDVHFSDVGFRHVQEYAPRCGRCSIRWFTALGST